MKLTQIQTIYQKIIRPPKFFWLITTLILVVFITILPFFKGKPIIQKPPQTPSPSVTPIVGPILIEEPIPTPPLKINWTDKTIDLPSEIDIYKIDQGLANPKTADLIAQKMGFLSSNENSSIDENLRIWSKNNSSLLINFKDNAIYFDAGITSTNSSPTVSQETYLLKAQNYLQNIFGSDLSLTVLQNITYFSSDTITTVESANLIRVTFYQSINNYPLATISQTGGIITIYLNKDLTLSSLTIKNAYSQVSSIGKFKTTPLANLLSKSNSYAQRINSSDNIDISVETVSAKSITFNQSTTKIAYLSRQGQLIPVYLLEGSITTSSTPNQFALYILPIIN